MGEQPASDRRSRFLPQVPLLDVSGDKGVAFESLCSHIREKLERSFLLKILIHPSIKQKLLTLREEFFNVKKEYVLI